MYVKNFSRLIGVGAGVLVLAGSSHAFSLLSQKWAPGLNTAQLMAGNLGTPGGASWSIMAAGLGITGAETHGGALTTNFGALIGGGTTVEEIAALTSAMNTWASVSGFTNLGLVTDGGVLGGGTQASGAHLGDIRFGRIGGFGSGPPAGVLAHAFTPGTEALNGAGGTIGGDTHFNELWTWGDGTGGTIDFETVALHEIGHALGLGHSTVTGSVMEATYAGVRRTLHADDIAGITTIYGPVPEPATMALIGMALLAGARRKRKQA